MTNNTLDLLLIDTHSANTIGIADISIYATTYSVPDVVQVEITPPGFSKITVDFVSKNVNIYRALDLGLTCEETCMNLPDGIYEVKYSTPAPKAATVTKYFIKIDNIINTYNQKFLSLDLECNCSTEENNKNKKELFKIKVLLEGSIASANTCDLYSAQSLYRRAESMLKQLACKH